MRRLTLLLVALGMAWYGASLIATDAPPPGYAVRDALILGVLAWGIFLTRLPPAWRLSRAQEPGPQLYHWPLPGRFLAALGVGLAVAAAFWVARLDVAASSTQAHLAVRGLWMTAVLALGAGIFWPGPRVDGFRPRYRWETDAAGRPVRRVLSSETGAPAASSYNRGGRWALVFIAALVLGAACIVRFGQLTALPAGCIDAECTRALALGESLGSEIVRAPGDTAAMGLRLFDWLSAQLFRVTGDGLLSLRGVAAALSLLLLPLVYALARLYSRAGGAAVAVIVLALSPWLIWTARTSHMWVAVPLLVAWTLWAGTRGLRTQTLAWWGALGAGLGALLLEAPELRFFTLVWAGLWLLETGLAARRHALGWAAPSLRGAVLLAGLIVVALPGLAWHAGTRGLAALANLSGWLPGAFQQGMDDLLLTLLGHSTLSTAAGPVAPLLAAPVAALVWLGVGVLVSRMAVPPARVAVVSLALWSAGVLSLDWLQIGPAGALLPLASVLAVCVAAAADPILYSLQTTWRPLISMPRNLAATLIVLLLVVGGQLPAVLRGLDALQQSQASSADSAMGEYLAACLNAPETTLCATPDDALPPYIFVPGTVFNSPNVRYLAGAALEQERVRALDITRDLLPEFSATREADAQTQRGRIYFVPLDNPQLLELLQQTYPGAEVTAPATEAATATEVGPTLFAVLRVTPDELSARQGLQGAYAQGTEFSLASEAEWVRQDGPLRFAWGDAPPLDPPFTVAWEGSLVIPEAGMYAFAVELDGDAGSAGDTGGAVPLSMQLDERLVLDTTLGLTRQELALAQGPYRLRLYLRVDSRDALPRALEIRWQPPGGTLEAIPRQALYSPPLPQVGLLATYYGSDTWQGPILAQRKDLVLTPAPDLPQPYSVRWVGKVAATRAGEYVFAASGNGLTQVLVDGRFLFDYAPGRDLADDPGFAQAGIYLARGWRDIEIRHAPDGPNSDLRILWQPPGSGPELLRSRYLLPITGQTPSSVALPPLPELWDARLGDERFALSYRLEGLGDLTGQPVGLPPANLAALPLEPVWRFAACGSGMDQLNAPHGVAIDPARGVIYVADTGNQRVASFALENGTPLFHYTDERFEEPTDIALAPSEQSTGEQSTGEQAAAGPVFVLDAVGNPVFRLEPALGVGEAGTGSNATAGTRVEPVTFDVGFYRPRGFDVDESGVFWIADTGGARVAAVGADGQLLTQVGGLGTTFGRGQPVAVTTANGTRWAVTAEDGRLWQLETEGSIPVIQRVNTIDGPHLAALPNGSFFLTDPVNRGLTLHAPTGEPLRRYHDPNTFVHPTGIDAVQAGNRVLVAVVDSGACGLSLWQMPAVP